MNQWECVQVKHQKSVGQVIKEYQSNGWSLHTYSTAQLCGSEVNYYLLFEKSK
ncbi:MAG: hypothetical protein NUK63_10515 [Candidatus Bathyarchaeum tardum]|nr:MAG: hypothetical protein NUK63_10515 [Candidatus Bathyarchaeum tardum]